VRQCAAVCANGSVRAVRAAVCGSALYIYIYTKLLTIYIGMPSYRGGGNGLHIPRISMRTIIDQYKRYSNEFKYINMKNNEFL
jgi:hypothetical protein